MSSEFHMLNPAISHMDPLSSNSLTLERKWYSLVICHMQHRISTENSTIINTNIFFPPVSPIKTTPLEGKLISHHPKRCTTSVSNSWQDSSSHVIEIDLRVTVTSLFTFKILNSVLLFVFIWFYVLIEEIKLCM